LGGVNVTSLRAHFEVASMSLRLHFDGTSLSLRSHFGFTSMSFRLHFDITSVSLRCQFHFTSVSLGYHFVFTSLSLLLHFDLTRVQVNTSCCKREKGNLGKDKREKGKRAPRIGNPIPPGNQTVPTHERNEATSRLDSPPNLRYTYIYIYIYI